MRNGPSSDQQSQGSCRSARRRARNLTALALLAAFGSLLAFGTPAASADSCSNAQFRTGPSANLPDCRAYEQVSPVDKNNYDILFGNQRATTSGDAITFSSFGAFANNPAGPVISQYLASRTPSGWSTDGISLPQAPSQAANEYYYQGFSSDLSRMVLSGGALAGAAPGSVNLFRRHADGSLDLLTPNQPASSNQLFFDGASADYSHLLFEPTFSLLSGAPQGALYEWVNGQLSLVSVLPNGTQSQGNAHGQNGAGGSHVISDDGSRVYWWTAIPGSVYLRVNGSTTEITASQCTANPAGCATGSGSSSVYWTASSDGSKAFFTSNNKLTNDSTASFADYGDLYQYNAASGQLADLTVDQTDPGGADVQGVVGASDDGSYLYFVAGGVLASGASSGQPNLYLRHGASTTFIATLNSADVSDQLNLYGLGGAPPRDKSTRWQVSGDGLHLLYTKLAPPPSGYDNAGHSEVYRYDATAGKLTCVSCDPSGAPATGDAVPSAPSPFSSAVGFGLLTEDSVDAVNNMSADGSRVFFETTQALVPQDTNGTEDVYEWEADGTGSCQTAGGCVYLVSSGRSGSPSYFLDTTPSGNDAFFLTHEQLVGEDTDANVDVYDARVGGGFPPPPPAPVPCSQEDCHGQPTGTPVPPVAASVTFFGPANPTPGAPARLAKVKVLSRVVHGSTFLLTVKVPAKGRITISGAGIRTVRRSVAKAGTYRVKVALTAKETQALKHQLKLKLKLKLKLHVAYAPASGNSSTATVSLTVKPALHHPAKRARAASHNRGGAR